MSFLFDQEVQILNNLVDRLVESVSESNESVDKLENTINDIIEEIRIGNPSTDSISIILEFEVTSGTKEVSTRRNSTKENSWHPLNPSDAHLPRNPQLIKFSPEILSKWMLKISKLEFVQ